MSQFSEDCEEAIIKLFIKR